MSADIRLDPATLGYLSQAMTEAADGIALAEPFLRRLVQILDGRKSEAEARPPLLSDWILAANSSRHGPLRWRACQWDDTGWLLGWSDSTGQWSVLLVVDWHEPDGATITAEPRHPLDSDVVCRTPAELRAALDRLAAAAEAAAAEASK